MANETGPIQPMAASNVQENFEAMVNHVLTYNPDVAPQLVKRRLNTRLRQVQDRRMWGGLMVRGQLLAPASYTTGTAAVTRESASVQGTDTLWPYNDSVNTTLSSAITITNEIQDITPASMTNINAGDWLLFDSAGTSEYVLVISVESTTFRAIPTVAHSAGVTIWKSSYMRRQFRVGLTSSFYNIKGIDENQIMTLDMPWGHATNATASYSIVKVYYEMEPDLRMIWSVVNSRQGWRLGQDFPQQVINAWDVWRQTTGWSWLLVDYVPDEIGRFRYEMYPPPTSEQEFPYIALRTVSNMTEDEDTPPPCIPSHMLVNGCIADVLLWNKKSKYYDLSAARVFRAEYEIDLQAAVLADDSIYMQNLQWAYNQYPFVQHGSDFWQSHDYDSLHGYL